MKSCESLELAIKESLAYNLIDNLDKLHYVDLFDKKAWCMAEILSHTEDTISVHYESWNVKYDEPYLFKSCARLATFRNPLHPCWCEKSHNWLYRTKDS